MKDIIPLGYITKNIVNSPALNETQLRILRRVYKRGDYAFWNTGFQGAGSFEHCLKYGTFKVTIQEHQEYYKK